MISDRLAVRAAFSPVCLGLDTRYDYLPESIKNREDLTEAEKIFLFNKKIIDSTADIVGCYKVQVACYEANGLEGMRAYADTVDYAKKSGNIVIGDVKRGDIASTADQYAKAHFTGDFEVDYVTLNPYMGYDAIEPYLKYVKDKEKGLFILTHTSNPSAGDFQEQKVGDDFLYEKVADKVDQWGREYIGESGYSALGSVVGLTYQEAFEKLLKKYPHMFFLVPGYGAQGGSAKEIADILRVRPCAVVNNSRQILTSHVGKTEGDDFVDFARAETEKMRGEILQWL